MKDNFQELLSTIKLAEILDRKDDDTQKKVLWGLAIIGAVSAVAGIAYFVYKRLHKDYVDDFDDPFDEEFDADFYDELEKEEAKKDAQEKEAVKKSEEKTEE